MLFVLKLVAFLAVLAAFAFKAVRNKDGDIKVNIPVIFAGLFTAVCAMILLSSFGTIGAGDRGVVQRFGAVTGRILDPGLYMVVPVVESVHSMNVQVQKEVAEAEAVSRDMQAVKTQIALNYFPDPAGVAALYKQVGDQYKDRIVDPAIQEAIKAVTAKFTAESLVVNRHLAKERTIAEIRDRLSMHDIKVDAVNITDFDFDPAFKAAIEAKVTSNQLALKAKNDAEIVYNKQREKFYEASADSNVTVAAAKAEAEAIKVQSEAIREQGGQAYVQLKWIDAWREGGAQVPIYITGSQGQQFLMQMPAYERTKKGE